ncbi:MAG: hypothetical protein LBN37_08300 [Bacteroidales bacterium]|nr:hypothetical protein [Bacteroidales bacterium]
MIIRNVTTKRAESPIYPSPRHRLGNWSCVVCALTGQHINICWAYSPQDTRTFTTPSVAWGWDMKPFIFDELALAGLRFRAKNKNEYKFGGTIADNHER